jgi:uncharacterized phage infection (PIP) family protein YhgE
MEPTKQGRHVGRKIWYSVAILMSALILLLAVGAAVGTWAVERSLSDLTVTMFAVVEDTAGGLRQVSGRIDQGAGNIRDISSGVSDISTQISQNVENKGLIALLLPDEQEQKLVTTIQSVQDTLSSIADVVTAGMTLYNSIDGLPFVNLPKPSQENMAEMQQSVADTQAAIDDLRQSIQVFRTGVSEEIGKVTQAADRVTETMDSLKSELSDLDSDLAEVQEFADRIQSSIPVFFALGAGLITLLLAYVAYTQVEVIRLLISRWRMLGAPAPALPEESEAEAMPPSDAESLEQAPAEEPASVPEEMADQPEMGHGEDSEPTGAEAGDEEEKGVA